MPILTVRGRASLIGWRRPPRETSKLFDICGISYHVATHARTRTPDDCCSRLDQTVDLLVLLFAETCPPAPLMSGQNPWWLHSGTTVLRRLKEWLLQPGWFPRAVERVQQWLADGDEGVRTTNCPTAGLLCFASKLRSGCRLHSVVRFVVLSTENALQRQAEKT